MRYAILDSSVYVGYWQGEYAQDVIERVRRRYIVRQSAVVLCELRRGASTRDAEKFVEQLYRLAPVVWEPTAHDWWEAGRLVRTIGDREDWDPNKRRSFQNDALIALTARRHGAAVMTANLLDFGLLAQALRISVLAVP